MKEGSKKVTVLKQIFYVTSLSPTKQLPTPKTLLSSWQCVSYKSLLLFIINFPDSKMSKKFIVILFHQKNDLTTAENITHTQPQKCSFRPIYLCLSVVNRAFRKPPGLKNPCSEQQLIDYMMQISDAIQRRKNRWTGHIWWVRKQKETRNEANTNEGFCGTSG